MLRVSSRRLKLCSVLLGILLSSEVGAVNFPPGSYTSGVRSVIPQRAGYVTVEMDRSTWTDPNARAVLTLWLSEDGGTVWTSMGGMSAGGGDSLTSTTSWTVAIPQGTNPLRRWRADFVVTGGTVSATVDLK